MAGSAEAERPATAMMLRLLPFGRLSRPASPVFAGLAMWQFTVWAAASKSER
jgi:hypothetical protein